MTAIATTPAMLADAAIRALLETQWAGLPAVRLDSPPGAGKTGAVERLAVQSLGLLGERCMIATMTNEQAIDLARRLAGGYPRLPFWLFVRAGLILPDHLSALPNLLIARTSRDVPTDGPCVVIANAARWSWSDASLFEAFDLLIVDEAFQLPDHRFQQIAALGRRLVLIGDPGQIAPVVTCEIERWRTDPSGPHVASPRALLARYPDIQRLALPISRRLVADTVQVVQPAFYPDLPFTALAAPGERGLRAASPAGGDPFNTAIDLAAAGASLIQVELPPAIAGEVDEDLADAIVALIQALVGRGVRVRDGAIEHPLDARSLGVVCGHVSQVNAVRERLPIGFEDVFVETADRFQGLERQVMIVYHPLSGRADASEFHLDAGRMCVALSRHRVACFVVSRAGIEDLLLRYAPQGERSLVGDEDREYAGWRAQLQISQSLRRLGRIVPL